MHQQNYQTPGAMVSCSCPMSQVIAKKYHLAAAGSESGMGGQFAGETLPSSLKVYYRLVST